MLGFRKTTLSGTAITLSLSLGSLILAAWLGAQPLRTVEWRLGDALMKLRVKLEGSKTSPHIVLIGLDEKTRDKLGKFSGGRWAARGPYLNQLRFFREYLRPDVLAYDINFKDSLGAQGRGERGVSESPEVLQAILTDLNRVISDEQGAVSLENLEQLAQFEVEQGTLHLAHQLAGAFDEHAFPVVLAYNLSGGWADPQVAEVEPWSRTDLVGPDPEGELEDGERLPYLLDVRIPSSQVVVPPQIESIYDFAPNANTPGQEFLDYSLLGHINVPRDADGVVRRAPLVLGFSYEDPRTGALEHVFVPSLSLMAAMLHLGIEFPLEGEDVSRIDVRLGDAITLRPADGDEIRIPIDEKGRLLLNYDVGINDFPGISFSEFAIPQGEGHETQRDETAGRYKGVIDGRIVVVGMVATGDIDIGPTPLDAHTPFVTVHLTAIHNILERSFIRRLEGPEALALYIVLFILISGLCIFIRSPILALISAAVIAVYLAVAYAALASDIALLPLTGPILYVALCGFGTVTYAYAVEDRDRRMIRGWFSKMVSPTVLHYLEDNPELFSLEGSEVDATVQFSDVVDFTSISEQLSPERVTSLMNAYLTEVTTCMQEREGYVNKYIGDMVMAVWGAPYPVEQHALVACRAALEQQRIVRSRADEWEREFGGRVQIRMGVNSGLMKAGGLGSEQRLEYTVMGDPVNLASRLEPLNKDYGTNLIIGPGTAQAVRDELIVRHLDRIVVKGKQVAVDIYELLGEKGDVEESLQKVIARYEEALHHHHERRWKDAMNLLRENLTDGGDGPSRTLSARISGYMESEPGPDWQGEFVRHAKY